MFEFGLIRVRLFRPFNFSELMNIIPKSCKNLIVLDRAAEFSTAGTLYRDVCAATYKCGKNKYFDVISPGRAAYAG